MAMKAVLCVLLLRSAAAWTTIHQTAFGAQYQHIAEMLNRSDTTAQVANTYKFLGRLWHSPFPCDADVAGGVACPGEGTAGVVNNPSGTEDLAGLGGGIAYAWDPNLCDALLPIFKERITFYPLIACSDLRMAMNRAFLAWSNNHRLIKFIDVTEECERRYPTVALTETSCPLVELWITSVTVAQAMTALGTASGDHTDAGVPVALAEGSALPSRSLGRNFRMSNGVDLGDMVWETYKARISFGASDSLCWYLDSNFCSNFHVMKNLASASTVHTAMLGVTLLIVIFGAATCVWKLKIVKAVGRAETRRRAGKRVVKNPRKRFHKCYDEAAEWSVGWTTVQLVMIFMPFSVLQNIFEPCFNCYDFEGAAVHEIGHVLGLGHPNTARTEISPGWEPAGDNVYNEFFSSGGTMARGTNECRNPWLHVKNNTPPGAALSPAGCTTGVNGAAIAGCVGIRPSVMEAFTQNNPSVCLSHDDVEAVHTLYPDCEVSIVNPVCYKVNLNLGIVRVAVGGGNSDFSTGGHSHAGRRALNRPP
jgi:hypothetical protein